MNLITLAVEVDLLTVGAFFTAVVVPTLTAAWIGGKKVCGVVWVYAKEKLEKLYSDHVGLVEDMRANVPKVSDTLDALKNSQVELVKTQNMQCNTLQQLSDASSRHEELHAQTAMKLDQTSEKIDQINDKLSSICIIGHASNVNLPAMDSKPGDSGVLIVNEGPKE